MANQAVEVGTVRRPRRFADRYTDHQSWTDDPCAWRRASTFLQVEAIANTILQWNRLRVVK
jgi:hypothetical protein